MFASATEHSEDEHKTENQPEDDRAENDQADVTSAAYLLNNRGVGVGLRLIGRGVTVSGHVRLLLGGSGMA